MVSPGAATGGYEADGTDFTASFARSMTELTVSGRRWSGWPCWESWVGTTTGSRLWTLRLPRDAVEFMLAAAVLLAFSIACAWLQTLARCGSWKRR